jgi:hypothetical protein
MSRELQPSGSESSDGLTGIDPADGFVRYLRQTITDYARVRSNGEYDAEPVPLPQLAADSSVSAWLAEAARAAVPIGDRRGHPQLSMDEVVTDVLFAGSAGLEAYQHGLLVGVRQSPLEPGFSDVFDKVPYDGGGDIVTISDVQVPADIARAVEDHVRRGHVSSEADVLAGGARIISRLGEHGAGVDLVAGFIEPASSAELANGPGENQWSAVQLLPLRGEYNGVPRFE